MPTIDTTSPAALMRQLLEAIAAKDLEAMKAMQHDDVVEDSVVLGEFDGKEAVAAFFSELFAAVPDMQFTINRIVGGATGSPWGNGPSPVLSMVARSRV